MWLMCIPQGETGKNRIEFSCFSIAARLIVELSVEHVHRICLFCFGLKGIGIYFAVCVPMAAGQDKLQLLLGVFFFVAPTALCHLNGFSPLDT